MASAQKNKIKVKLPFLPENAIQLLVNGKSSALQAVDLLDNNRVQELRDLLSTAKRASICHLARLIDWEPRARLALFAIISCARGEMQFSSGHDDAHKELLDAVVGIAVNTNDLRQLTSLEFVIAEVIAIRFPLNSRVAATLAAKQLRIAGIKGVAASQLEKQAKEIARIIDRRQNTDQPSLQEAWTGITGANCDEYLSPPGWRLTPTGASKSVGDKVVFDVPPMFISECLVNETNQCQSVRIHWKQFDVWTSRIVSRDVIADTRKAVGLAEFGVPITSNHSRGCVEFLAEFEAANAERLTRTSVSAQLGWQGSGFLLGHQFIGTTDPSSRAREVVFRGADAGDDQLAQGYRSRGQWLHWDFAVRKLRSFQRVMFAVYGSVAAALLKIVGIGSIVIDYSGQTTVGKTTALGYGASVWGECDPSNTQSLVRQLNGTMVSIERTLSVICDLPVFLDETKLIERPEDLSRILYLAGNGKGRNRGTPKGLAEQPTTRNITIISGEQQATSATKDGGTCTRVLAMCGHPFGETSSKIRKLIGEVNALVRANYGHAGPIFVAYLASNPASWSRWQQRHRELTQEYQRRAGDNAYAGRIAPHLAVIKLAAELAYEAKVLSFEYDPIEPVYSAIVRELQQADRLAEALSFAVEYANSHWKMFARNGEVHEECRGPILGNIQTQDDPSIPRDSANAADLSSRRIEFYRHVLRKALIDANFNEPDAMIRGWREKGWLVAEPGRTDRKTKIGADRPRVIAIRASAYDLAGKKGGASVGQLGPQ